MENNVNRNLQNLVRFTIWFIGLLIFLICLSSCNTKKRISKNKHKVVENISRELTTDTFVTNKGDIYRVSLKSYVFTDSLGVQVRVPVNKVVENISYENTISEQTKLGEVISFEENISTVQKDVDRRTNFIGLILGLLLILLLAFIIKKSTNLLRPFSFL
jgi:hypothetical protein